jgi:hypothetical protein
VIKLRKLITENSIYQRAERIGRDAFHSGKMRAPIQDKELMKLIKSIGYRTTSSDIARQKIYQAWLHGWSKENLKTLGEQEKKLVKEAYKDVPGIDVKDSMYTVFATLHQASKQLEVVGYAFSAAVKHLLKLGRQAGIKEALKDLRTVIKYQKAIKDMRKELRRLEHTYSEKSK